MIEIVFIIIIQIILASGNRISKLYSTERNCYSYTHIEISIFKFILQMVIYRPSGYTSNIESRKNKLAVCTFTKAK